MQTGVLLRAEDHCLKNNPQFLRWKILWFSASNLLCLSLSYIMKVENISGRVGDGWLVKKCNETIENWWDAFCGSQAAGQERQFTSGRTAGNSNPCHLDLCDFIIFIVTNSERNTNRVGYKWKWAGFSKEWIVWGALAGTYSRVSIWYQPAMNYHFIGQAGYMKLQKIFHSCKGSPAEKMTFQTYHLEREHRRLPTLHL